MNRDGETSARLLELTQRVEELEKNLEEYRKDAERYRYMRDNTSVMTFEDQTWVTSHKLDMRIDKAITQPT